MLDLEFMLRPVLRASFPLLTLLTVFVACSSEDNDFFGGNSGAAGTTSAMTAAAPLTQVAPCHTPDRRAS